MKLTTEHLVGLSPKYATFVIEYCKDWDARRAAEASGYPPDYGYQLVQRPEIQAAVDRIVSHRAQAAEIDAEWVLMEAVDNHRISRQRGNLAASNKALDLVARHIMVDAFAAQKVDMDVNSSEAMIERLHRGRARVAAAKQGDDDDDQEVSFL